MRIDEMFLNKLIGIIKISYRLNLFFLNQRQTKMTENIRLEPQNRFGMKDEV